MCTRLFERKRIICAVTAVVVILLSSAPPLRDLVATPLVMTTPGAKGDACYVLAGGGSLWERLDAAADLIQMNRVSVILLMREDNYGQFSFKAHSSWTRTQWAMDYLAWRGVPKDKVTLLPKTDGLFGTLTEAQLVSKNLPVHVRKLVIVSSAPHMRRATLAFRRSLPSDVEVVPCAATTMTNSYERYHPIWLEYLKLLVYYWVA